MADTDHAAIPKCRDILETIQVRKAPLKDFYIKVDKFVNLRDNRIPTCIPIVMTRVSPFIIISRRDMNKRIFKQCLILKNSWGKVMIEGEPLTIFDEDVLLILLALMKKKGDTCFQTTLYEICKMKGTVVRKDTANAIWKSLMKIGKTSVDIEGNEIIEGKKHKIRGFFHLINGAVLREVTGKINIEMSIYFYEMLAKKLMTYIDLKERLKLKGDVTKALHRFLEGQSDFQKYGLYQLGLLKLCNVLNMEDKLLKEQRRQIRDAVMELIKKEYLKKLSGINKNDTVLFWRILRRKAL